ncbi:hypothetical protein KY347_00630 [Candidatus Woesearchaeota archaeon]|nr:hypothetical protein [Candidatus Woesearchaeota archaeon]
MKKRDWKKFFLLSWKNLGIAIITWFAAVILHNAFYALFGFEEAIFFIIAAFIIPLYLIISIIYTAYIKIKIREGK